jgi:predicted nuclease of predicted toxin-antitoxin system
MKILLDENLPRKLKSDLAVHDAKTVRDMRWLGKRNGELMKLMNEAGFDVFITTDKSLRHQQPIDKYPVRIVLLLATSNKYVSLQPMIPDVLRYLKLGKFETVRAFQAAGLS